MTTLLATGQVLTPERLTAEIERVVDIAIADFVPPTPTTPDVTEAPKVGVLTQQPQGRLGWWTEDYTSTSDDVTLHDTRTLLAPAAWVRLGFSYDRPAGSACTITGAIVAQTSKASPVTSPVDESGAAVPWTTVTFNNGGADVSLIDQINSRLASTPSPVTSFALRNPPSNANAWSGVGADYRKENYVDWSDWIQVRPFLRTDGGALPLLMSRVKYDGDVSFAKAMGAAYDSLYGKFIKSYVNAGDCVTTPENFSSTVRSEYAANVTVQYIPATPGFQVLSEGDSNEQPYDNHVAQAVAELSTAATPIEFASFAKGGNSVVQYTGSLLLALSAIRPSVIFVKAYSPAGTSEDDVERGWAWSLALIERARAAGAVPVVMTGDPSPFIIGSDTVWEERRTRINARVRALAATGVRVLDIDAFVSDNATPVAAFLPGYSNDGLHRNSACHAAIKTQLTVPLLREILGI